MVLSEYEKAREVIIARNRARLEGLGVLVAARELQQAERAPAPAEQKKRPPPKRKEPCAEPVRKSRRLRSQSGPGVQVKQEGTTQGSAAGCTVKHGVKGEVKQEGEQQGDSDVSREAAELGAFIVDGECPKCGRVVTKGHRKHLAMCTGKPAYDPTLSQLVEIAVKKVHSENEKLNALELEGLVEFTDDHATFMVTGSTGKHYQVKLADAKHKCKCIDHCCRQHDCKHIKLLLKLLGIADEGKEWRPAVTKMILEQAVDPRPATDQKPLPVAKPRGESKAAQQAAKFL